jgi:hypothetical protein
MAYEHMTLYKITEFYTKQPSVCPNITSKCLTAVIFKISVKIKLVGMSIVFQCTELRMSNKKARVCSFYKIKHVFKHSTGRDVRVLSSSRK